MKVSEDGVPAVLQSDSVVALTTMILKGWMLCHGSNIFAVKTLPLARLWYSNVLGTMLHGWHLAVTLNCDQKPEDASHTASAQQLCQQSLWIPSAVPIRTSELAAVTGACSICTT